MLKPAILYKEEIEKKFMETIYSDNFFLYAGYPGCHEAPNLEPSDENYRYAIINPDTDEVIGYFAYHIDFTTDCVSNFGLFSFDPGNIRIGHDLYYKMKELADEHRRIEWRMIGGNPVQRTYDKFCEKYNGNRVILHEVTKDEHGNWHDEYIYEILRHKEE